MPKGYKRPFGPTLLRLTLKDITEITCCLHELQIRLNAESRRTKGHEPSRPYRVHVLLNLRRTRKCIELLNPTRKQCVECKLVKRLTAFYHHKETKYGMRADKKCKRCRLDHEAWARSKRKRLLLSGQRDRKNASEATDGKQS